eukprot:gb/GECG01009724.1/.p1 GENE.gb/GECG01009724.1/~~gb/GECG01009724.1/.p1  ORF type:complete len:338 (+),score=37.74 gb/GECG01009724.1/:1-1014(+)
MGEPTVETGLIQCEGSGGPHRIAYSIYKPPSGAPTRLYPVLCVHALTRNQTDYKELADTLCRQGYEVGTIDVVGRGLSDYAKDAKDYNVLSYAKDIVTVLDELQWSKVHWVGTSMGGLISMVFAGQHDRIKGLVMNDIGPYVPAEAVKAIASYVGKDKVFRSVEDATAYLQQNYSGFSPMTEQDWAELGRNSVERVEDIPENRRALMESENRILWTREGESSDENEIQKAPLRLAYDTRIRHVFGDPNAEVKPIELWDAYSQIQADGLLLLHGSNSPILLEDTATKMVKKEHCPHVNGPRMCIHIENCGHVPSLKHPFQLRTVLGFLEEVEAGTSSS